MEAFARATHTPIGYLFLPEPPVERLPVTDFRTMGGAAVESPSPDLLDTLHLCQQRQDRYREEARTAGEPPLEFVGGMTAADDILSSAAILRDASGFDVERRRRSPTWEEARRLFIEQADASGVLVMVSGVVGSNTHRRLAPEKFRGFALSDPLAPLVFINGADTRAAQMFTLTHEIAHVWLGESGVSNAQAVITPDRTVERWCNRVAAEMLVPARLINEEFDAAAQLSGEVNRLARRFKVGTPVVLRRIHDLGGLGDEEFRHAYHQEMDRLRGLRRGGGGNPTRNVRARVGKRLAQALVVSTLEGRTSYTETFRLLGIKKLSAFERLAHGLGVDA